MHSKFSTKLPFYDFDRNVITLGCELSWSWFARVVLLVVIIAEKSEQLNSGFYLIFRIKIILLLNAMSIARLLSVPLGGQCCRKSHL